jgi:hypothetical protein
MAEVSINQLPLTVPRLKSSGGAVRGAALCTPVGPRHGDLRVMGVFHPLWLMEAPETCCAFALRGVRLEGYRLLHLSSAVQVSSSLSLFFFFFNRRHAWRHTSLEFLAASPPSSAS